MKRKTEDIGALSAHGISSCEAQPHNFKGLPVDVLEHVYHFLDIREVVSLSSSCKLLRDVAASPRVWADLIQRSFLCEELPQDLEFLRSHNTSLIRSQLWQLIYQRPAFLSDAPRTSEILEHTGSRFRKVLHVDGRRDFNFTTVFRDVPPGQYNVVWRIMLQPGYVRGYCNFRAVFSRPAAPNVTAAHAEVEGGRKVRPSQPPTATAVAAIRQKLFGRQRLDQGLKAKSGALGDAGFRLGAQRALRRHNRRRPGSVASVAPLEGNPEDAQLWEEEAAANVEITAAVLHSDGDEDASPGGGLSKGRLRRHLRWFASCIAQPSSADLRMGRSMSGDQRAAIAEDRNAHGEVVLERRQAAVEASDARGAAQSPVMPTVSRPAPSAPVLPQEEQQEQEEQVWLSQAAPTAADAVAAAGGQSQHPEIEPVLPLQQQEGSQHAWQLQQQLHPQLQAQQRRASSLLRSSPPPPPQEQQTVIQRRPSVASANANAAAVAAVDPQPQVFQRAMSQLATTSAKRDAALAAGGGPRYVPRWLSPLWGSHACSWRQLDPSGPLGHGAWRSLQMGTLTLRRRADAHLHGVMVQLRPTNAAQQELALPQGETRWRGALMDYVELVPVRNGKPLGGLLRGLVQRSSSPVVPEVSDVVEVPRL